MNTPLLAAWNPSDPAAPAIMEDGRPESPRAHAALLDYLLLGPGRSLPALLQQYRRQETAPTHSHGTLRNWSLRYAWPDRAAAFDALADRRQQAEMQARREAILQRGLALEHERVERLTALYEKLSAIAADDEAFWVRDVRFQRLPDGSTERIDLRRFNGALIRNIRGLLDDIAAETGGRPLPVRLPAPEKPPLDLAEYSLEVLSSDERAEFIRLHTKVFSHPTGHAKIS